jgi:hypothetical protein
MYWYALQNVRFLQPVLMVTKIHHLSHLVDLALSLISSWRCSVITGELALYVYERAEEVPSS